MGELDKHEINQIIQSMSKIYTSAYYIDLVTNEFTELSSLTEVRTHIGASGNAQCLQERSGCGKRDAPPYFCLS